MSRFGVPPSLGVPVCSCRHHCDAAGAFVFNGLHLPAMWHVRSVEVRQRCWAQRESSR